MNPGVRQKNNPGGMLKINLYFYSLIINNLKDIKNDKHQLTLSG